MSPAWAGLPGFAAAAAAVPSVGSRETAATVWAAPAERRTRSAEGKPSTTPLWWAYSSLTARVTARHSNRDEEHSSMTLLSVSGRTSGGAPTFHVGAVRLRVEGTLRPTRTAAAHELERIAFGRVLGVVEQKGHSSCHRPWERCRPRRCLEGETKGSGPSRLDTSGRNEVTKEHPRIGCDVWPCASSDEWSCTSWYVAADFRIRDLGELNRTKIRRVKNCSI